MKDLHDGQNVVGVGYEPFRKGQFSIVKVDGDHEQKKTNIIINDRKTITLYPNGDSYHNGWTVTIKASRYPTLKKVFLLDIKI